MSRRISPTSTLTYDIVLQEDGLTRADLTVWNSYREEPFEDEIIMACAPDDFDHISGEIREHLEGRGFEVTKVEGNTFTFVDGEV